ncbi:hypothetical protein [Bradyrhizobium japonicum]|uniref:hypothetical protein n=1 Tax=Bradyrhizobium japonicum TaxID=375 RepID=UPI00117DF2F3|nr:hypothetical protein [Bradyrhizobium japonicum]
MRVSIAIVAICCVAIYADSQSKARAAPQNFCRTIPDRANASDWPSKHAWDLFVSLNHPAIDKSIARGVADCSRPFGDPGSTSVWETWRNARTEVYLSDGREPPLWDDTSLPDEKAAQVPPLPIKPPPGGPVIFFSPDDGVFHNAGGFGETRLNRATYEFVRSQCLFSIEGQKRYAAAVDAGKKPPIQFPSDAIEVKAAWLDFEKPEGGKPPIPVEKRGTYYTAEFQGKKFGLVALHILTKDLTNWFWATFRHKDAPTEDFGGHDLDNYGPPKEVAGTVWDNYRLGGTQTDFSRPTGEPTIVSDHYVEFGFQRSSCITCHATASISREIALSPSGRPFTSLPNGQAKAVCSITPGTGDDLDSCKQLIGKDAFKPGPDTLLVERGVPDPNWFQKDGKPFYLQTDFVWSIPFRGRSEAAAPPSRCNF